MKIELKDFQDDAVDQLIKKLNPAKREVAEGGDHQAGLVAHGEGDRIVVHLAAMRQQPDARHPKMQQQRRGPKES